MRAAGRMAAHCDRMRQESGGNRYRQGEPAVADGLLPDEDWRSHRVAYRQPVRSAWVRAKGRARTLFGACFDCLRGLTLVGRLLFPQLLSLRRLMFGARVSQAGGGRDSMFGYRE